MTLTKKPTRSIKESSMEYKEGQRVLFHAKHGESERSGQEAFVEFTGNNSDESGVAHAIRFDDGHSIWAYPQEMTLLEDDAD